MARRARGAIAPLLAIALWTGWADAQSGPTISSLPPVIYIGDNFVIGGSGFTPGSVANFFVATSNGAENFGPLIPNSDLPDSLAVFLPLSVTQGEGVASVVVVNTDQAHIQSNTALALLQGEPASGLPSLTAINGIGLSPTSTDPGIALANVETVVVPGATVTLTGSGFDTVNGIGVDLFCDCAGGKIGPFVIFGSNLTPNSVTFTLPSGPNAPAIGPGAFRITNLGNFFASAAVSVPIGEQIAISSVTQSGPTVTVEGQGFSGLTVLNLFNLQSGTVVNLGGLRSDGSPKIPLNLLSDHRLQFNVPAGVVAGPAYVQALNPPFIPFTSSGNSPGGAFAVH